MTWTVSAVAAALGLLVVVLGDLVSEEVRGRLDTLPRCVVRLAVRFAPPSERESLLIEYRGELFEFLRGNESRPITRLVRGSYFAFGVLRTESAARIGRLPTPRAWLALALDRVIRSRALRKLLMFTRLVAGEIPFVLKLAACLYCIGWGLKSYGFADGPILSTVAMPLAAVFGGLVGVVFFGIRSGKRRPARVASIQSSMRPDEHRYRLELLQEIHHYELMRAALAPKLPTAQPLTEEEMEFARVRASDFRLLNLFHAPVTMQSPGPDSRNALASCEVELIDCVRSARDAGETWRAIGAALGTSSINAYQRFMPIDSPASPLGSGDV